jgi:uncharacterized protein YndB with AHSA1/START domain
MKLFFLEEIIMADISNKVTINVPANKVFEALTEQKHLAAWWTDDCVADKTVGGKANFEFDAPDGSQDGYAHMRIEKLVPGKLVESKCIDQSFRGMKDWIGTTIRFNLSENGPDKTNLDFIHSGWKDKGDLYNKCTDGWAHFMKTSLKNYLEQGKPEPHSVLREKQAALEGKK